MDSDCINSLYTFDHMQDMCSDPDTPVSNPAVEFDKNQKNKTVIVDAGRIYKLPFAFSIANLLPKCRHYSSLAYNLFTSNDETDTGKCVFICIQHVP